MNTVKLTAFNIRRFIPRDQIDKALSLSVLFSVAMITARIIHTGHYTFLSLIWNLFLGFLPYLITRAITREPRMIDTRAKFIIAFLLWLFWMPNAFYIITDLFHLGSTPNMPRWFDLALILSCAWNGMLMGVLSVRQMEKIWHQRVPQLREWWFLAPVMFLNAWGIYIGRFLRYNTWDILSNPFELFGEIVAMLVHPFQNKLAWSMVLCYAVMMSLMYVTLKQLSKAIR
ncbi:MAG: DUF1361 domain-containing protein [Chitinophagaceae bacterium]|nr:DUF1361 domain-containing protein [Chitinophagaceae bacterium]